MPITMYGIKNCDTISKARAWLEKRKVDYRFHDYKTAGIDRATLERWTDELGWEVLLNRAGTTFRKLADTDRVDIDQAKAVTLMESQPSMIKRPLLDVDGKLIAGFKTGEYEALFG